MYNAAAHPIFTVAGARWKGNGRSFIDKFSSNNSSDRITAVDAWDDIVKVMNDDYETWLLDLE